MVSNVKNTTSSGHMQAPGQQNRGATVVRQQVFSARRGGQETDQEQHTGELKWGGMRGRTMWHGTYARRLEAHLESMRPQSGLGGEARAMSRKGRREKGGKGGRLATRQHAIREMAVASGRRRRRGRRRCTRRGWQQPGGGRRPPPLRSNGEIA